MTGEKLKKIIQQSLLIFYTLKREICPTYISKIISNCAKQIILLMIPNVGQKSWHYLALKKLPALLRGITYDGSNFYCLNCHYSFRTGNKLKSHEKVYKNKDFRGIVMSSQKWVLSHPFNY